jgi:hypothetical protein
VVERVEWREEEEEEEAECLKLGGWEREEEDKWQLVMVPDSRQRQVQPTPKSPLAFGRHWEALGGKEAEKSNGQSHPHAETPHLI